MLVSLSLHPLKSKSGVKFVWTSFKFLYNSSMLLILAKVQIVRTTIIVDEIAPKNHTPHSNINFSKRYNVPGKVNIATYEIVMHSRITFAISERIDFA